jgi:hypothetical protein
MTAKRNDLFSTRWVHVSEEDTADGAVYRPDDEHVPLSRKPREWLELHEDGSGTIFVPGPDDRPVEQPTTWQDAAGTQRTRGGKPAELEIVDRSPRRIVVRRQPKA